MPTSIDVKFLSSTSFQGLSVAVPFSGDILYCWRHFTGYRKRLPNSIIASWFSRSSRGIWVILILFCWNHRTLKWSVGFCCCRCFVKIYTSFPRFFYTNRILKITVYMMLSFSNTDTCNKKWYATLIILFGYVTRRRDGNLNDPTPLSLHSNNLDIQSTVFVSFHLNSIRCKRDLVSLLEKNKGKTMFRHGINETKLHNIWCNHPCRQHQSSLVVFNFQTFICKDLSVSFLFLF